MNTLRNQVTLVGNLGTDVTLKDISDNRKVANLSLATNRYYKKANGEKVKETQWHNIVIWGNLAEVAQKITSKGDQVMVQGRLTYRQYQDANGENKRVTEILVSEYMKLTPTKGDGSANNASRTELNGVPF